MGTENSVLPPITRSVLRPLIYHPVRRIEDLQNAVRGAGLEATQMSKAPLSGSLVFAEWNGIRFNSGLIDGRVSLEGALSQDLLTFGTGLRMGPGTWHWYKEVFAGDCGQYNPGDSHISHYASGSLYLTASMPKERLVSLAARHDYVVENSNFGETGIKSYRLLKNQVRYLEYIITEVHCTGYSYGSFLYDAYDQFMQSIIREQFRLARPAPDMRRNGYERIVSRARSYIVEHLQAPLHIDSIADAAKTSNRTLHRAFLTVFNEPPYAYVQRLRLHRIRHALASEAEAKMTVTLAAQRWGFSELGRMAGLYRELFGELPSQTLSRSLAESGGDVET